LGALCVCSVAPCWLLVKGEFRVFEIDLSWEQAKKGARRQLNCFQDMATVAR